MQAATAALSERVAEAILPKAVPPPTLGSASRLLTPPALHPTTPAAAPPSTGPISVASLLPGIEGPTVSDLHQLLRAAGQPVDTDEERASHYGASTANAVRALQLRFKMDPTGIADQALLSQLQALRAGTPLGVPAGTYIVEGPVNDANGEPLVGGKVVLNQITVAGPKPQPLGQAVTDARGFYRVTYPAGPAALTREPLIAVLPPVGPARAAAGASAAGAPLVGATVARTAPLAIQVQLVDASGNALFTSAVIFSPPPEATVPIHLGGPTRTQPPEFSAVTKTVAGVVGDVQLTDLVEHDKLQQLSFAAGSTGLSKPTVAFASIAARLGAKTQLPPELFYGLLRHNVPPDGGTLALAVANNATDLDVNADRILRSIYSASDAVRSAAIGVAIANNTVSAGYQERAHQDLAQLSKLATDFRLSVPLGTGKAGLGDVLTAAGVPLAVQQSFAQLLVTAKSRSTLWKTLSANKTYPPAQIATLKFATSVGTLTRGHLPLVSHLVSMRTGGTIKGARDLAKLTAADWKGLLQQNQANGQPIGAPAGMSKQDPAGALDYYAGLLETAFTRAFPTTAFVSRLANDATSTLQQKAAIAKFVDANPAFSLPRSNIDTYLSDHRTAVAALGIDVAAMREDLLVSQRMIKVTPSYAAAKPMLDQGIRSAHQIYRMGRDRFVTTFGTHPAIGTPAAVEMFGKARQIHARALALFTQHNAQFTAYSPAAITSNSQTAQAIAAAQGLPNLAVLFGSLDQCACRDCQSVLSAGAYLVDMLYFLSQHKVDDQTDSVKNVLLKRRPDIAQILLTCDNTNTELPYIDLVNEILEAAVAPGDLDTDLAARQTTDKLQTTLSTPELNAFPEHVNQSAYHTLAKTTSVYPWVLPFDLPLAEARTYLGQLSVDRARLMKLFTPPSDYQPNDVSSLAVEMLGLSSTEAGIILATAGNQLWDYWGLQQGAQTVTDPTDYTITYSEGSWTDILRHVRILLARSALTFDQLSQLLNTTYLNPDGSIILAPTPSDSCDLATMVVTAPNPAAYSVVFDRLHRFVRLWRHLGWTIDELDSAIRMLQPTPPGGDGLNALLLRQLAVVLWATKRFKIPVVNAIALFAVATTETVGGNQVTMFRSALDTHDVPAVPGEDTPHYSLYHNLFQNKTVLNPPDAAFDLSKGLAGDALDNHTPALVSALALTDADVRYAIAQLPANTLTLANIGLLFSYATLSVASNLSLKDLVRLVSLHQPERGLLEIEQTGAPGFAQLAPDPAAADASGALFDASTPERLVTFAELLDQINHTTFSVAQLDYLLRHNYYDSAGVAPDNITIGTFYFNLRNGLAKLAQGFFATPDPLGAQTRHQLNLLLAPADATTVMQILAGTSKDPDAVQTAAIGTFLAPYMDATAAQTHLVGAAALLQPGEPRYEYVLTGILHYQARVAGTALSIQQLANEFALPVATAAQLATAWLPSRQDATKHLIDDLLALPGITRPGDNTQPISAEEAATGGFAPYHFFESYVAAHKFATVINGFGFTADETKWIMTNGVGAAKLGWLDPTQLPLATSPSAGRFIAWRRLADAAGVKKRLPSDGTSFTTVFDNAATMNKAAYFDALVKRTQWSAEVLKLVAGDKASAADKGLLGLTYPDDFKSERALTKIIPCVIELRRLGISADLSGWIGPTITRDQAADIIRNVKAKYSVDRWPTIAKPLRDPLREQQRNALLGYMLAHPPQQNIRWADTNDVYGYYLIDVEMSSCALTSRIVQANASIQLFVQRCFLNLESGITIKTTETSPPSAPPADTEWLQWQWMHAYRLWQANREVFLYPENWIDPSLRRDKSPFYSELETDLRQNPITTDSAEDAYRSYLEKLDAVARLDVVGLFHDTEVEGDGPVDYLHVVARGQGSPAKYYYRQWIDHSRWTAWTEIKLDILSEHVLPVVWNRRLYLFWALVNEKGNATQPLPKATDLNAGSPASPAETHLEIQLAWSEFKKGKWLGKQVSPQVLVMERDSTYDLALKSHFDGSNLVIDVFAERGEHAGELWGRFVLGGVGNAVDAYLFGDDPSQWDPWKFGPEVRNVTMLPPPTSGYEFDVPTASRLDADAIIHDDLSNSVTYLDSQRPRVSYCYTTYQNYYGTLQSEVVLSQADWYRLIVPHQVLQFDSQIPFFFQDSRRTYFVVPSLYTQAGYFTTTSTQQVYHQAVTTAYYTFYPFYHAFVPLFIHELNRGGVDQLFNPVLQQSPTSLLEPPAPAFDFSTYYAPTTPLVTAPPPEGVDFDPNAGYSIYNWELFFHTPFEIAKGLSINQRFQESKHWYEYIFNPTSSSSESAPQRFWVTQPFHAMAKGDIQKQQIAALMQAIHANDSTADQEVAEWQKNPFDPHLIAVFRPVAYMRAVVMNYIDNLIAWGDQLFRQNTLESVNEATQYYVLAAQLLGPKPEITPPREVPMPQTYADLEAARLDRFANAVVAAENAIGPVNANLPVDPNTPRLPLLPTAYFCIPPNDRLLKYWDTVGDRLFKIRHCMNIEGVTQQLALFAPPIDPGILVRAVAAGVDLGSILSDMSAPASPYRFEIMIRHALEVCEQVRSFGAQLLSILEKDDAEALALLRSTADKTLQSAIVNLKQRAIDQAQQEIDVIDKARVAIQKRSSFYEARRSDLTNTLEAVSLVLQGAGIVSDVLGIVFEATSGAAAAAPNAQVGAAGIGGSPTAVVDWGGSNISNAAAGFARAARVASAILHTSAAMTATLGSYQRRMEDWNLQADTAAADLDQNTSQCLAASIRQDLATLELQNQQAVAQTASDVDDFLHSKFTNQELYDWMIAQSSATYLQAYQLAYAIAKRAERCFQRELGLTSSAYIQFGYWDSLRKGLLAGDQLLVDLQTMNADYRLRNVRERELTASFSLLAHDPFALVELRTKGKCFVKIPKLWFDLENPSLYMRRAKSVSVTVPCVVGPYTSVSMTVTLMDNQTTTDTQGTVIKDSGGLEAIITSTGINDSGFELRQGDERYYPFEGSGVEESTWQLQLNPVFPQFDYSTISDVVLQIRYTARDGGEAFAQANRTVVADNISKLFSDADAGKGPGLFRLISVRHEYPSAWSAFLNPGSNNDQVLRLDIGPERFPFFTYGGEVKVDGIDAIAKFSDTGPYHLFVTPPKAANAIDVTMTVQAPFSGVHWGEEHLAGGVDLGTAPAVPAPTWSFKLQKEGAADFRSLASDEVDDLILILQYQVKNLVAFPPS
jgi:peptidoglycan hydrolase-like protein with peptidoglycan-binding domain